MPDLETEPDGQISGQPWPDIWPTRTTTRYPIHSYHQTGNFLALQAINYTSIDSTHDAEP